MRLLINADDFGISESVNHAIDYCFNNNIIQRTTILVNMDSSDSAVALSKEHGYADKVGLHLNLIEGTPLTELIKNTIFCTNGVFNGQALRNQRNRFLLDKQVQNAVKCELRAQIEKYIGYGFTLYHIDSHEHTHTNPSIFKLLCPLIREYGFLSVRLSRNIPEDEITGLKSMYKNVFNKKVRKLNKYDQGSQWHVAYFGSQSDVEKILGDPNYKIAKIEVETHPVFENDRLIDAISSLGIEEWISHIRV